MSALFLMVAMPTNAVPLQSDVGIECQYDITDYQSVDVVYDYTIDLKYSLEKCLVINWIEQEGDFGSINKISSHGSSELFYTESNSLPNIENKSTSAQNYG